MVSWQMLCQQRALSERLPHWLSEFHLARFFLLMALSFTPSFNITEQHLGSVHKTFLCVFLIQIFVVCRIE